MVHLFPRLNRIPQNDIQAENALLWTEIVTAVEEVLQSGQFILGAQVEAFEEEVAAFLGVKYAVGVSSGTDALIIALHSLGIGPGDEVITTPFTFFATAEAISRVGANPVFVDIDSRTFNLNPDMVPKAITSRTKAILPVHLYGQAVDLAPLLEIAASYGLKVIEDVAQAFGGEYGGKKLGTFGDVGCFSFFPTKRLGGVGDGGLIATDSADTAELARLLRVHGSPRKYFHTRLGYNARLDELQAAVLRPERIDPGNKQYRLENTPKLVAGVTADCLQLGQDFYRSLAIEVIPVSTPTVAEMAKLLENTYRDVNIAFINEMAEVCRDLEIDIWEVIAAAATKPFGFQPFYPGIGVGGHCIPKDSAYYLFWARQKGRPAHLVELARKINAERPMAVAAQLKELVAVKQRGLAGSRLLFLGATYKKDVDDIRESPAVKIMERCAAEGAEIAFHDPYIEKLRLGEQILSRISLDEETLAQYQWTILTVPHSSYDYPWLQTVCAHFVDVSHTLGTRDK